MWCMLWPTLSWMQSGGRPCGCWCTWATLLTQPSSETLLKVYQVLNHRFCLQQLIFIATAFVPKGKCPYIDLSLLRSTTAVELRCLVPNFFNLTLRLSSSRVSLYEKHTVSFLHHIQMWSWLQIITKSDVTVPAFFRETSQGSPIAHPMT